MDATTRAEGFYYSVQHLLQAGCIENEGDETTFAFHSGERWSAVREKLQKVWGYGTCWGGPSLITVTNMRDGRANYVFRIERL